jgi:hypothetical protein
MEFNIFKKHNKPEKVNVFDIKELALLEKFFTKSGIRELESFVSDSSEQDYITYNFKKHIHSLNETANQATLSFNSLFESHELTCLYYDNAMGGDNYVCIAKK